MKYSEGTCFLVTLEDGGYAVGVIARASKGGASLLTYYFAPRLDTPPTLEKASALDMRLPVLIARTGNRYLKSGQWPVLGRIKDWQRSAWPMPFFLRIEPMTERRFMVTYREDDPVVLASEEPAPAGFEGHVDSYWGCAAIESWLTVALTPESEDRGLDNPAVMSPWSKEGFITKRGKTESFTVSVSAPVKMDDSYVCEIDAGPALSRMTRISAANPERARRRAMNMLRMAVHERKIVDEQGRILEVPVY